MRQAIKRVILAAVVLSATAFASSPTLPDWAKQAIAQEVKTYPSDTNAVVLLKQQMITVVSANEYIDKERRVVRILRPEGKDEAIFRVYVQSNDSAANLHVWSMDQAGHTYEIKQKEFFAVSPYTEELYSDVKYFHAEAQTASPGSVVVFESEVRRRPFLLEFSWDVQEDIPVRQTEFQFDLPAGFEYSTAWANHAEVKPERVGTNGWKWSLRDEPALADEPFKASNRALAANMHVAYFASGADQHFASWAAIAKWHRTLTADRRVATPEVAAKAHQLAASATTFDAKLRAIAQYAQRDVRYVAIEIGIGGWQPHSAADVSRHAYGDCKDKTTVMAAMLAELGIRSEYVLIHSERGIVKKDVPSGSFDHVVIAIELPADAPTDAYRSVIKSSKGVRYLIFDPTDRYTPVGSIRSALQGGFALLATDPGEVFYVPYADPDQNSYQRAGKFKLNSDGSLTGKIEERRAGDSALYARFSLNSADAREKTRMIEATMSNSQKHTSLTDLAFENVDDSARELVIKYSVAMDNYAQTAGPLLLVRPRVLGDKDLHLSTKKRTFGVNLRGTLHDRDVYEIELPAGYKVDELPDPTKVDVGFMAYESHFEVNDNVLRYVRDYIVRNPEIPLEKMAELRKVQESIAGDEYATAVLKKAP